jgi:uncharacterized protein
MLKDDTMIQARVAPGLFCGLTRGLLNDQSSTVANSIDLPVLRLASVFFVCIALSACASYGQRATTLRDGLLHGDPKASLAIAEETDLDETEVISSLDKGMIRRFNQDFTGSNQIFEVAKKEIEKLHGISISENLASVTINETLRGYEGDPYEQLLLHAYMAMNYIQLGRLDDARVEMLQANVKMMEWGDEPNEDAFLRYLEGIIYESLGEYDNALISYRKAYTVYKEKKGELYPVIPDTLKKDMLRLLDREGLRSEYDRDKKEFGMPDFKPAKRSNKFGDLIVILNNGLAPVRQETAIYLFSPEVQQNLRVAFPVYAEAKGHLLQPSIVVASQHHDLETVEDVDAQARHALSDAMPGIMARATARAVVKYNTQHSAEQNGSLAGLLMTVTNLITERADTRSWSTLPQEIQLQRIRLPVGEHHVQIQMLSAAGMPVDVIERTVTIRPQKISFVIEQWVAPVIKKPAQTTGTTADAADNNGPQG